MLEALSIIGGIILVDLALSGDNALVIGAAAATLPRSQRLTALAFGGAGAIVLRIVLTIAAAVLLRLPLIEAAGGLIVLVIAVRLLTEREEARRVERAIAEAEDAAVADALAGDADTGDALAAATDDKPAGPATRPAPKPKAPSARTRGLAGALLTIIIADLTMSLDNVLAIGALAAGHLLYLAIGLVISIGILLIGSALVAELIDRLPWLLDFAAFVLAWTTANMVLSDARLGPVLARLPGANIAVYALAVGVVIVAELVIRRGHAAAPPQGKA